mgnify:CR=1 FL=1
MKKIFYILASAIVALGAVACNNELDENINANTSVDGIALRATIDEATRVTIADRVDGKHAISLDQTDVLVGYGVKEGVAGATSYEFTYNAENQLFECINREIRKDLLEGGYDSIVFTVGEFDSSKGKAGIEFKAAVEPSKLAGTEPAEVALKMQSAVLMLESSNKVALSADKLIFSGNTNEATIESAEGVQYIAIAPIAEQVKLTYLVEGEDSQYALNATLAAIEANHIYNLGKLNAVGAMVDGVKFTNLNKAAEAAIAAGVPMEVVSNAVAGAPIVIEEGQALTINFADNTSISGTFPKSEGHVITNNGTLTIVGGTINSIAENGGSAIINYGVLNLEKTTVNGAPCANGGWASYAFNNYGEATLTDVKVESNHGAIAVYGKTTLNNCEVVMNGFGGSSHVFYAGANGELVVNGGTYTHKGNVDGSLGYIMSGAKAIINDGTFEASNGGYGFAAYVGAIEINGGTFKNALQDWGGPISIKGGTFYSKPGDKYIESKTHKVNEGTDADSKKIWTVVEKVPVATIEGDITKFETLAEAFAALKKGDILTINEDVTLTEGILVNNADVLSDLTINGGDHTITLDLGTDGTGLQFGSSSNNSWATGVKINNLTIDGEANIGLYLCGGTSSKLNKVTIKGTYNLYDGFGGMVLYGTHGATLTDCDIVNGFSNGQDDYPVQLVNSKIGKLIANGSEAIDGAKVFVDENSHIDLVYCGSYKSNMIDTESLARIGKVVAELNKKGGVASDAGYAMTAEVEGILYAAFVDAAAEANNGATINVYEGEFDLPASFAKDGRTALTIKGAGMDKTNLKGSVNGNSGAPGNYANGVALTFEDLTFTTANNGYNGGFGHAASVEFNNSKIVGQFYCHSSAPHSFKDCVIDPLNGYLYTYASDVTFENCDFAVSKGKALQVYEDATAGENTVIIKDCEFSTPVQATTWDGKPVTAIDINSNGAIFNVYIDNCTATGFGTGLYSGSDLWNIKNNADKINLVINGMEFITHGVWATVARDIYELSTVEALQWFAEQVNTNGNTFKGATVRLAKKEYDLAGISQWIPVGNVGATQFAGTFDGQDATIKNLKSINSVNTIANYATGFFGWVGPNATIQNLNIVGADIAGLHYVAAVAGKLQENASVKNCRVEDATIEAVAYLWDTADQQNGDKVGAIVGYADLHCAIEGNTAKNITMTGYRDMGGIVGYAYGSVKSNKVEGITFNVDNEHNYKEYTMRSQYDINAIVGEAGEGATVANNTANGVVTNWGDVAPLYIYVYDADKAWTNLTLYSWENGGKVIYGDWPGAALTETVNINGKSYYRMEIPLEAEGKQLNAIVNNGGNGKQTPDFSLGTVTTDQYLLLYGGVLYTIADKNDPEASKPAVVEKTILYLKPNANWKKDNARFAAYFFRAGETWVDMTDTDKDGIYEVEVPTGFKDVIFCRMSPSATANNWNNKWNQTADLKVPTDGKTLYTVKENTWDNGGGTWSAKQ